MPWSDVLYPVVRRRGVSQSGKSVMNKTAEIFVRGHLLWKGVACVTTEAEFVR